MGLKINGSTSGSIEIDVPAVAGTDTAITIPATTGGEFIVSDANGNVDLGALDISGSASADSVVIDSSGNVGIGTTSPNRKLTVADNANIKGANCYLEFDSASANYGYIQGLNGGFSINAGSASSNNILFYTSSAERMRLASTGVSYVWNNNATTAFIAASSVASSATVVLAVRHSASSITGGTNAYFIYANGTAGSASDVNLKKNIETTRDGYLEDLNRLRVVKYNWNDQEDTEPRELGLIAQEVEEVFPGLACDMKGEDENGEEITTKGIKYSVLPVMLLKALQEADAKIEAQATQLASLEARLTALEGGAS